jgi:hypothetical protein
MLDQCFGLEADFLVPGVRAFEGRLAVAKYSLKNRA